MSPHSSAGGIAARVRSLRARYARWIEPRADGLPRLRVLASLPVVLLLVGAVLVGAGLNGSSSGAYHGHISEGADPDLLAGEPQEIRSDEWNVGVPWIISQVEQGFPERNETFPGGMDADLPYDLPHSGPSIAFKPHLWGFLLVDTDHGMAWKWWVPGLALIAAAFAYLVTLLPRRPLLSAGIAVAFFYSPFFQWWYQATTLWPAVWALVALTAMSWGLAASRARDRWLWAPVVAYFTVVMAMGVYAPFIVPVAYVVIFAAIGTVVAGLTRGIRPGDLLGRAAPVVAGGVVGSAITLLWLRAKEETVDAFLSTTYPGERFFGTGAGDALLFAQMISSSFSDALRTSGGFLGLNSSEASTFFFAGVFLLPVLVWIIIRRRRQGERQPWIAILLGAVVVLVLAWMFVPGWDAVSHLLMLDRTTPHRMRIGLGVASLALLAHIIRESGGARAPHPLSAGVAVLFVLSQVAVALAVVVVLDSDHLWGAAPLWWLWALACGASLFAFSASRSGWATALLLVVALATSATVHPVYRGVLDLRETEVSQHIEHLDDADAGTWVGVGGGLVGALLVESGVEALNGSQGAPSQEMWKMVDPDGSQEQAWNRIGAVRWVPGEGEPVLSNPAPDVIQGTFDGCSDFAQGSVDRVLSDVPLGSGCLLLEKAFPMPGSDLHLYSVVRAQ